ncbi:MAG: chemotaxis protein CheW [Clostridium sp.]
MQFVVFKLGDEQFALNTEKVREINDMMSVTRVPKAPDYIIGLINLRGSIKSLIDLSLLINFSSSEKKNSIIILKVDEEEVGIAVDDVIEVVDIAETDIQSLSSHTGESYIRGIINIEDKLVTIIEVDDLLN